MAWDPAASWTTDYGVVVQEEDGARAFFHRDEVGEMWERLRKGQRVVFTIVDTDGERRARDLAPAADHRTWLRRMEESAFWRVSEVGHSEEDLVIAATWAIESLPTGARLARIVEVVPRSVLLRVDAGLLAKALPSWELAVYWGRMASLPKKDRPNGSARRLFVKALRATDIQDRGEVWRRLEDDLEPFSPLWAMAPDDAKTRVLERGYGDYLRVVRAVRDVEPPVSGMDAESARALLDENDGRLSERWVGQGVLSSRRTYEQAKMLSARLAERVVAEFYRRLGRHVEDVAVRQLDDDPIEARWRSCDLVVDGTWIDVKNARTTTNQKQGYVEHAVPAFKQDRHARDVVVAAVLSPYLQLDQLKGEGDLSPYAIDVTYLGETRRDELDDLERRFTGPYLQVVVADRRQEGTLWYVPPWAFDLPDDVYAWRRDLARELRELPEDRIPPWSVVLDQELPSVGLYLAAGVSLPDRWSKKLPPWAIRLVRSVLRAEHGRVRLPDVYLSLLSCFLEQLRGGGDDTYDPLEAYRLMVLDRGDLWDDRPAGCHDPLSLTRRLSNALHSLWSHREQAELDKYRQFRYVGRGLLQGRRDDGEPWDTILAYCGGWVEGRGKCGASPLVVGLHRTCPSCRKLVCSECLHCSDGCEALEPRRAAAAEEADVHAAMKPGWRRGRDQAWHAKRD